jgi:flagellar hook-length control protein FliK
MQPVIIVASRPAVAAGAAVTAEPPLIIDGGADFSTWLMPEGKVAEEAEQQLALAGPMSDPGVALAQPVFPLWLPPAAVLDRAEIAPTFGTGIAADPTATVTPAAARPDQPEALPMDTSQLSLTAAEATDDSLQRYPVQPPMADVAAGPPADPDAPRLTVAVTAPTPMRAIAAARDAPEVVAAPPFAASMDGPVFSLGAAHPTPPVPDSTPSQATPQPIAVGAAPMKAGASNAPSDRLETNGRAAAKDLGETWIGVTGADVAHPSAKPAVPASPVPAAEHPPGPDMPYHSPPLGDWSASQALFAGLGYLAPAVTPSAPTAPSTDPAKEPDAAASHTPTAPSPDPAVTVFLAAEPPASAEQAVTSLPDLALNRDRTDISQAATTTPMAPIAPHPIAAPRATTPQIVVRPWGSSDPNRLAALPVDQRENAAEIALGPLPTVPAFGATTGTATPAAPPALPQLAAQIVHNLAGPADGTIEITLAPAELGKVRLRMRPDARDPERMVVVLSFDRPETHDLFRRHADQLAEAIRSAGYSGVDIGFDRRESTSDGAQTAPAPTDESVASPPDPANAPITAIAALRLGTSATLDLRL